MNRAERRHMAKLYRHAGLTKEQAKATANQYLADSFKEGDLCKINFNFCLANPQFKLQKEEFQQWVYDHKNEVLTVDKVKDNGKEVTFVQDTQDEQFWFKTITLLPVAKAIIKLDDGTEKTISLEGVSSMDDPTINEKINEGLSD